MTDYPHPLTNKLPRIHHYFTALNLLWLLDLTTCCVRKYSYGLDGILTYPQAWVDAITDPNIYRQSALEFPIITITKYAIYTTLKRIRLDGTYDCWVHKHEWHLGDEGWTSYGFYKILSRVQEYYFWKATRRGYIMASTYTLENGQIQNTYHIFPAGSGTPVCQFTPQSLAGLPGNTLFSHFIYDDINDRFLIPADMSIGEWKLFAIPKSQGISTGTEIFSLDSIPDAVVLHDADYSPTHLNIIYHHDLSDTLHGCSIPHSDPQQRYYFLVPFDMTRISGYGNTLCLYNHQNTYKSSAIYSMVGRNWNYKQHPSDAHFTELMPISFFEIEPQIVRNYNYHVHVEPLGLPYDSRFHNPLHPEQENFCLWRCVCFNNAQVNGYHTFRVHEFVSKNDIDEHWDLVPERKIAVNQFPQKLSYTTMDIGYAMDVENGDYTYSPFMVDVEDYYCTPELTDPNSKYSGKWFLFVPSPGEVDKQYENERTARTFDIDMMFVLTRLCLSVGSWVIETDNDDPFCGMCIIPFYYGIDNFYEGFTLPFGVRGINLALEYDPVARTTTERDENGYLQPWRWGYQEPLRGDHLGNLIVGLLHPDFFYQGKAKDGRDAWFMHKLFTLNVGWNPIIRLNHRGYFT